MVIQLYAIVLWFAEFGHVALWILVFVSPEVALGLLSNATAEPEEFESPTEAW